MEIRASYLLVGAVVLALVAGLGAFSIWLVKADIDRQADAYRGGPPLEAGGDGVPPLIASSPSTLERLFESTPDLLVSALTLVEQANQLLNEENLRALTKSLQNIETVTADLAR